MTRLYRAAARALQDRFDTRRLADRIEQRLLSDVISESDRALIERLDMLFLATVDGAGQPQCSYKGGDPGFVRVLDERTLIFPSYDGNGMFLSLGNVALNAKVGLLFVDFENQRRIRVNGTASIELDSAEMASYPGAQLIVRVTPTQVFPNCPRYVHKLTQTEPSAFVPAAGRVAPPPAWKDAPWGEDGLPKD